MIVPREEASGVGGVVGHRLRSLEFAKAIRTAQLHLNEVHMVLEVVVHVGGEFQGAIIIADLAQETFAKLVRVAYFAEEESVCRRHGIGSGVAGAAIRSRISWRLRTLPRERS